MKSLFLSFDLYKTFNRLIKQHPTEIYCLILQNTVWRFKSQFLSEGREFYDWAEIFNRSYPTNLNLGTVDHVALQSFSPEHPRRSTDDSTFVTFKALGKSRQENILKILEIFI